MDKVSIIIPVYNAEKCLERCLNSIINQTYKNIEIICINDGSKDESLLLLKSYQEKDSRLIIIDQHNAGVSVARNVGIKRSTGKYITFVDADDWLEENAIECLYEEIVRQKVDVVRGNFFINIDSENNESMCYSSELKNKKILTVQDDFGQIFIDKLLDGSIKCYVWLLMVKKDCIDNTSLFKEGICYMEDVIFYIELMNKIESIYFLDKPLYHYYCNPTSCSNAKEFFIRNIYNVLKVDKYITEIVKNSKYKTELSLEIRKAFNVKTIMGYLYAMYLSYDDKDILKKEIDNLLNDKEIYNLLSTANLNLLSQNFKKYVEKVLLNLLLKKDYRTLFMFYNLRKSLEKCK